MSDAELCWMSATDIADAIRNRTLSPVEVTRALLDRIATVNPKINAYCTVAADQALAAARDAESTVMRGGQLGALHGVPMSFKDLTPTAGIRTTFGSKIHEHNVPAEDAVVVERAKRAGAIVLGKTNTPEFGCKGVTDNRVFGPTRNPWNLDRMAGGSSGGAAAALAAGLGPIAEGSDLGGSIRMPASACGVVGLKPTAGRVPRHPAPNGWTSFSCLGPMARTVRDAALLLSVLAGPDERDPSSLPATGEDFARAADGHLGALRVAWSPDLGYATVDPEVASLCAAAAKRFGELGCSVDEANPGFENPEGLFVALTAPGRAAALAPYLAQWRDQMDPVLVTRIDASAQMTAVDYEKALHGRTAMWQTVRRFFERYDVLLTPTLASPPFPVGRNTPAELAGKPLASPLAWMPFCFPFAMTAQPAMSIPCGFTSEGLPVGLQIVGRRFAEATLLRVAAAFETAQPWGHRRPGG